MHNDVDANYINVLIECKFFVKKLKKSNLCIDGFTSIDRNINYCFCEGEIVHNSQFFHKKVKIFINRI